MKHPDPLIAPTRNGRTGEKGTINLRTAVAWIDQACDVLERRIRDVEAALEADEVQPPLVQMGVVCGVRGALRIQALQAAAGHDHCRAVRLSDHLGTAAGKRPSADAVVHSPLSSASSDAVTTLVFPPTWSVRTGNSPARISWYA